MNSRKLMLKLERTGASIAKPYSPGGRALKAPRKPDGGGKKHGRKKQWSCVGCDAKPGQRCKRWDYRRLHDAAATYLRDGGFSAAETQR